MSVKRLFLNIGFYLFICKEHMTVNTTIVSIPNRIYFHIFIDLITRETEVLSFAIQRAMSRKFDLKGNEMSYH